ncbi:MAG: hypothetical protein AAF688_06675, partial [Bacteroidota bacterium]
YYSLGNGTNTVNGLIRAGGITQSFDFFGFLNLISFYFCYQFYNRKYAYFFSFFLILSLSFKFIILFGLLLFYLKEFKSIGLMIVLCSLAFVSSQDLRVKISDSLQEKYSRFFLEPKSPRPEAYKALKRHITDNGVFYAEGVGVFGGPASRRYESTYYQKIDFNWHGRQFATTDTYYPHLFIELGLLQGLVYLALIFIVFLIEFKALRKIFFLIFIFLIASILNFALNSFIFLIFSFVVILPMVHYKKQHPEKSLCIY